MGQNIHRDHVAVTPTDYLPPSQEAVQGCLPHTVNLNHKLHKPLWYNFNHPPQKALTFSLLSTRIFVMHKAKLSLESCSWKKKKEKKPHFPKLPASDGWTWAASQQTLSRVPFDSLACINPPQSGNPSWLPMGIGGKRSIQMIQQWNS